MVTLLLAAAVGCGSATAPSVQAVAGTYAATQLNTTANGTTTDQLAAGASITLTLNPNGTTSGEFIVPGELDEDLTGTWTLNGTTVELSHSADTFLRDMPFQVQGNALVGDQTFGGTRVRVRLVRQ
ncbi:MAG: hypothetical protein ABR499_10120 [Gemmatimonadaceae bacterium]